MKSFSVKENQIGSVVSEIIRAQADKDPVSLLYGNEISDFENIVQMNKRGASILESYNNNNYKYLK